MLKIRDERSDASRMAIIFFNDKNIPRYAHMLIVIDYLEYLNFN